MEASYRASPLPLALASPGSGQRIPGQGFLCELLQDGAPGPPKAEAF